MWELAKADQRRWNRLAKLAAWLVRQLHLATFSAVAAGTNGGELKIEALMDLARSVPGYNEVED